jgi:hypothetical protein
MIKETTVYNIVCDNCGKQADETHIGWNSKDYIREIAQEEGFIRHNHEDLCPDCYYYDDYDNLKIKDDI